MEKKLTDVARDSLEKQYTYSSVGDLAVNITSVYEGIFGDITKRFGNEILNFNTCTSEALDNFWGQIFKINRNFKDENDNVMTLNDEQFREIIKIRAFGTTWDGSIASMNTFLSELFKDRGNVYMLDPQNMTYEIFVFNFQLENWERYLFANYDIFPRSAGVASYFEEILEDVYFGFGYYGQLYPNPLTTGFGTYTGDEQGQFLKYDVAPVIGETYKLTIYTQPANAVVRINGKVQNGVSFAPNTLYTYEVSCQGYDSYSGSGRITENTILNVNLDSYKTLTIIPTPSDATVVINGETRRTFDAPAGTTYTYSVSKPNYITRTDTGVLNEDTVLNIQLQLDTATLTINPTPADATVRINGQVRNTITLNKGSNYSYTVSKNGYYQESGSGILSQDTNLNITLEQITYSADVLTLSGGIIDTIQTTNTNNILASSMNFVINGNLYGVQNNTANLIDSGGWTFLSPQRVWDDPCFGIKNGDIYIIRADGQSISRLTTDGRWVKTGSYGTYTSDSASMYNGYSLALANNGDIYYLTQDGIGSSVGVNGKDVGGFVVDFISGQQSATGEVTHHERFGWYTDNLYRLRFIGESGNVYDSSPIMTSMECLGYKATDLFLGLDGIYKTNTSSTGDRVKIQTVTNLERIYEDYLNANDISTGNLPIMFVDSEANLRRYRSDGTIDLLSSNCTSIWGIISTRSTYYNQKTAFALINNKLHSLKYNGSNVMIDAETSISNQDYNFLVGIRKSGVGVHDHPVLAIRQNPKSN